jgi:hypothetical protein
VTRTPVMLQFSSRPIWPSIESIYLYHVTPWFGPFASVDADGAVPRRRRGRARQRTWIGHVDGTADEARGRRRALKILSGGEHAEALWIRRQ